MTSTEQWLAQYKNQVEDMKRAAVEMEDNVAAATVTASSPDGAVTVTVGPNGSLRDLRFSHRAAEHTHADLAGLVMKTVAKAQREVSEKVIEAFAPIAGDSTSLELFTQFVPAEDPDDADQPGSPYADLAPTGLAAGAPPQPPMMPPPPIPPAPPQPPVVSAPRSAAPAPAARRTHAADDDDEFEERPW